MSEPVNPEPKAAEPGAAPPAGASFTGLEPSRPKADAPRLSRIRQFTAWAADNPGLVRQYLQIRKAQGTPFVDALKELLNYFLEHGPEIAAFIQMVISLFHANGEPKGAMLEEQAA